MPDIKKIDTNFENKESVEELLYLNPKTTDQVTVYGLEWFKEDKRFIRFPKWSDETILNLPGAEGLHYLVEQTAGVMIAFYSNTTTLKIKVKLGTIFNMGHMAFTGQGGVDLYIGNNQSDLTFYRTASYNIHNKEYEFTYYQNYNFGRKLFLLNLPLYSGIEDIEIGFVKDAEVKPTVGDLFTNGKIVVYGTSVTQGGCASRPGINFTNALSRRMNYEFLNYGFSGNGRAQKEVVDILTSIDDVKMYILDYEANATLTMMKATLENFIDSIRKKYPTIPILVLSKIRMSIETHQEEARKNQLKSLNYQKKVVKKHQLTDNNIYFYDGHKLLGKYTTEATVDGCHPTDLGFMMITENLEKELKKILNK